MRIWINEWLWRRCQPSRIKSLWYKEPMNMAYRVSTYRGIANNVLVIKSERSMQYCATTNNYWLCLNRQRPLESIEVYEIWSPGDIHWNPKHLFQNKETFELVSITMLVGQDKRHNLLLIWKSMFVANNMSMTTYSKV